MLKVMLDVCSEDIRNVNVNLLVVKIKGNSTLKKNKSSKYLEVIRNIK